MNAARLMATAAALSAFAGTSALAAAPTPVTAPMRAADCAGLAKLALPNVTITAASEVAPDTGIAIKEAPNPIKLPFAVCKV